MYLYIAVIIFRDTVLEVPNPLSTSSSSLSILHPLPFSPILYQ